MGSLSSSHFLRKTGKKLLLFLSFSLFLGNTVYSQCGVEAAFSYSQDCNTITFQNNSSAGSGLIASHFWDFGDGTTSVLADPQPHSFPPDNNYTVILSVTDTSGCVDSDTAIIQIDPLPQADFTFSFNGCRSVAFSNLSTPGLSYFWDFGDGNTSTMQTPWDHIYSATASTQTYNITLTVSDANGCIDSIVKPIMIYPEISAGFSIQNNNQCSNDPVAFDASASTGAVTYQWNFGDGNNLTSNFDPSAQHQYYSYFDNACTPDTSYNVSLMVSNPNMCFDYTSTNLTLLRRAQPLLSDPDNPSNPFSNCSNNPTPSNPDYTITVENITDMNCVDSLSIDWGDGSNVSGLLDSDFPLTHTYTSLGVFQLNVAAYSGNGCTGDTTYLVGNQSIPASVGINTPDNTVGCAPQTFWFEMTGWESNSPGTSYTWTFGDGSDPVVWNYYDPINNGDTLYHTYIDAACNITGDPDYDVTLTVRNLCMSRTTEVGGMYVQAPAEVGAESSVDTLCVGENVCFENLSSPGWGGYAQCDSTTYWTWDFGDGNTGNSLIGEDTCYSYDIPGTYTVQLIGDPQASTCGNVDTAFQITVIDVHPEFTADTVCLGDPTPFTDLSYVFSDSTYTPDYDFPITSWYWNFGDPSSGNNTSNQQNPTHVFSTFGEFVVSLTVGSAYGCDTTFTDTVFVDHVEIDSLEVNDLTCHDANDGSIYVYASYGTNNITYTLNPGPIVNTTGEFTNLEPGTYYLDVQNARGCDRQDTIIINNPPEIVIDSIITEDITCSGNNNGEIKIIASGGTGTLYYTLLPDNITNTNGKFDNLSEGTYTVSITDDNNCGPVLSPEIIINDPLPLVIDSLSTVNISCNGQNDGEIFIQASGGTGVITYRLMPGNVSNSTGLFTGLNPGTYNIEVTDENNCSINSGNITITGANELEIETVVSQDISCNGLNDGSISVTATGGTGALTYTLQPNGISNMTGYFNNLSGGTYFVEVMDQNGCSIASSDININDPEIISILTENFTDISCNGANDGSITIVATGGTGILTYTLMPGNISNTTGIFNNLAGGTYTVSVTDQNSCNPAISANIQILDPSSITLDSLLVTDLTCYGQNTGSIYLEGNGGTGNLTYTINPGGGSNNTGLFENLAAGSYTIDITDDNNCSFTTSPITINSPAELLFDNISSTGISCNGATDGTITTSVSGGTGAITYTLNPTGISNTTGVFNNLPAGTYNITATDENFCEITSADIEILEPAAISISSEGYTDISCNGADDGTISIVANGGTGNLQYTLQPNNITNTSGNFNNLTAGNYTVSITDDNNCGHVVSSELTITDPPALVIDSETATNSTCNGCNDGTIEVLASGGTGVLTYTLNPDGISNTTGLFTNLAPGSYSVDVEDENGCRISSSNLIINEPGVFNIDSINVVDVSCHDYNNGSISVYVSGGVTPYTFTLNPDGITNGTGIFNNLLSGNYTVTITDGNGYSITTNQLTVDNPPAIVIDSVQSENITCFGNTDGIIQAYASGGTGTLNYILLPVNDTNTTGYYNNLTAGTYQIAVTDMNACPEVISSDIIISEPTELTIISENATDMLCHDSDDGTIEVQANGGTGVLTYTLNPTGTTNNNGLFSNLSAGTYNVNVTDENACSVNSSDITINAPAELVFDNISSVDVSCNGLADGSINSVASGGTGAITYLLLPDNISNSTGIFQNLQSGTYQVVVTDANNCSLTSSDIDINEPAEVLITTVDYTDITCNGNNDGSITVTAGGGSGILTYTLQPDGINNSTGIFTDLAGGTYQVTVTDENSCGPAISSDIVINEPALLTIDSEITTDITCHDADDGVIEIIANGGTGILTYTLQPQGTVNNNGIFAGLAEGTYFVTVEDENGCQATSSDLNIFNPQSISFTFSQVDITCYGANDGSISILASGGTGSYSYSIDSGMTYQAAPDFNNLYAGTYYIMVRDSLMCETAALQVEVNQPADLFIQDFTVVDPTCNGCTNGQATANVVGGTPPYSHSWSNGATGNPLTGVGAGTYTDTVTDANGCTTFATVTLSEPQLFELLLETHNILCNGYSSGWAVAHVSGGTTPYNYEWRTIPGNNLVSTGDTLFSASAGDYEITVTDAFNNTLQQTFTLTEPAELILTTNHKDTVCYGDANGWAAANVTGGTPPYSYLWSNGAQTDSISGLTAGTYTVTVTDNNNCEQTASVEIIENQELVLNTIVSDPNICYGSSTQLTASVVGGTPPYMSYEWTPAAGLTDPNSASTYASPTQNTFYTVTVTDAIGCQISGTAFVEVLENPEADFSYQYPCSDSIVYFVDESGMLNGTINDWQWDFGDGTVVNGIQNPTHIFADPGNYTVSLTVYESQNGCSDTFTRTVQIHNLPDVDFSYGATCENEAVQFYNETIADTTIQSVFWDFGDPASGNNNYSTIQNPQHTYSQAGSYIVSLTVTDHFGCSAVYSESLTISDEPLASFSFNGGCANEAVQFTDQSNPVSGTMNRWVWEFGDGTTDTVYSPNDPNVSHLYAAAGNYLVTLTVENLGGCTNTIQHTLVVDAVPVADFSHENNCDSELVEFTDLSDPNNGNNINQWKWNFGDPASGNYNVAFVQNPVHQFSAPGTYPVKLIVTNANGCSDTIVKNVLIREGPGVDFTWDNPCVGEDTYFFPDTAVMNISEIAVWHWDFNDGIYSNEPSPVHQFPNNGVYNVELTVTDTSGCTASITHAVAVRPLPIAFFDFSEPTCSTDSVYFNDLSSTEYGYIDMWVWDFGDGSPKDTTYFPDEPHRYHNFPNEGTFFVTLEITNSFGCSNSFTDEVTVTEGPIANFYFSNACENEEVFFEDASFANGAGNIIAWDWIFDDPLSGVDNFSTEQNPSHIFSSPGSYDVRLIVTNFNNCQDTMMKTVIVKEAPLADFTWNISCQNQAVQFSIDTTVTNINVITDWFWDFGDGITSDLMEPEHMYEGSGIYTVTLYVQDTGLCPNTITKNITVHPEPVADFDFDAPSCQDSEIQFVDLSSTASGYINKWIWNYGDGIVDTINYPATPDPIHIYDTTGTFDVTLTIITTDSCENTVTKAISITPAPIADFEFEGSCSDAPVQFTDLSVGNGGINITQWYWDFGDPLSGQNNYSTLQNPVHIFSQPGTYSVSLIVVNTESCSDTIVQEVSSSELPDVDFVTDSANCFQDITFFFADSTIIDIPAVAIFEWNFGDGSNPVYQQNAQHMYQLAGEYNVSLTITDTSGCMNTIIHPVEIAPKPVAEYDYKNSCAEDSTVFTDFSYTLNGDDIIAWSWNFGDPASGNANYSNEQNPAHAFAQTGLYMVKLIVTAESGCVDSVSRQIEVFQGPTAAYSYLPEPCKDGMVSFTDLSTANQTSLADWFWEFEPGYNSTLRNPVHQFQQTDTSYAVTLTVTDGRGCTSSITDTVFVPAGLEVEINSTATCFKETMLFEPELISPAGDTLLQFKWNFGDPASGINNTSTIRNPEHLFLTPGAYTVSLEAMDQNGCWTTVYKQVTVDPLPVPDFTYESFQCDSSVYFTDLSIGNGAPIDYRVWNYGDGKPADTIYDPAAVNVVHLYDEPGYYTVQLLVATTNGCMDTISKEVLRESCIQAGISIVDTLICQGFEIAFADSSSNTGMIQQWQWNFGDGTDTTYNTFAPVISHRFNSPGEKIVTLYVTSQVNGSVLSDSMFIAVDVLPTPKPDFMAENVCLNQQSEFDNLTNLNNCQLDSWFWDFGIADTAVTSNEASPVYTYETADTFNVKLLVTATNGCYDSIIKETVVNPLPVADFEWELACRSLPTTFFDLSLDSLTTWSWNFGDSLTKHDTSSMRNPQYVYDSTGIYFPKLIVANQFGCTDTLQQKIEVYPVPTSNFSYEENYDDVQGQLHFLNESKGAESYWWLFGDGGDSEEVHPVYRFTEDGEYEVLLISTNEFGCPDSLKQTYNFMFKGLFVPNAFAPENPASEVRVFKPKGINLMEYELMIFDSWGHQLWSSDELDDAGMPTEGWDGTFNGKELPMDTYLWKIKAKFKDGSLWEGKSIGNNEGGSEETSGTVTLIR